MDTGRPPRSRVVRAFVDTNVLVYAFDRRDERKRMRALELIQGGSRLVLSSQVLGEFYVTVTRKLATPMPEAEAAEVVERLCALPVVPVDARLAEAAIATSRARRLSYWDAMIVEAAAVAGCEVLLTEDLSHGTVLRGVRVENPFRD